MAGNGLSVTASTESTKVCDFIETDSLVINDFIERCSLTTTTATA
jgi:hypothetical protein